MNRRSQNPYGGLELDPNSSEYTMSGGLNELDELWFVDYDNDPLTLDEKLTLVLGNMMYCNTDLRNVVHSDGKFYPILEKCTGKSWRASCRLIQEYVGVNPHEIDKKSMLLKSIRTFLQDHYDCTRPDTKDTVCPTRSELGHALRLYHLLGYDKNLIYGMLSEFQSISHVPTFDYIASQLKKSKTWKKQYVFDVIYWADRLALDINHIIPNKKS